MNKFEEIIDTYLLNYSTYKNGKVVFDYEYGELIFFKQNTHSCVNILYWIFDEKELKPTTVDGKETKANKFDIFAESKLVASS